ncbi:MAG TPA: hypothetical protein VFC07_16400 [Verrucomicrobiae bacterium]|nr:hypothetical protein [Verrucomicrobiae bacterium]
MAEQIDGWNGNCAKNPQKGAKSLDGNSQRNVSQGNGRGKWELKLRPEHGEARERPNEIRGMVGVGGSGRAWEKRQRTGAVQGAARGGGRGRFWGCSGDCKKSIFCRSKKHGFFAGFEKRQRTAVLINEYGCLVNLVLFDFAPKGVEKGLKKNIVSKLP